MNDTPAPSPKPRFRESAAIVLVRGRGPALEVFWARRSDAVSYMPGFMGFIGGKVAPEDLEVRLEGEGDETERVLRVCAIREAFEESGVLPGLMPGAPASRADARSLAEARRRLLAGEIRFDALVREHGWRFEAGALRFAGRWMTPPFTSQRFDTRFFLARAPEGQEASIHVGELASGEWANPRVALRAWMRGEFTFAAPILWMLIALAEGGDRGDDDDALAAALAETPERSRVPVRRIELKWGIVLHPMQTSPLPPATHTNAYLVGEREMALIDPGSGDEAEINELMALIEALETEGRRLTTVLLTHHHPDHVGGLEALRERRVVKVAAHAETAKHVKVDVALSEGERIPLAGGQHDWTLRVMHTPGHTRGHLSFLHERTRSLFCGDHIPGGTGTVIIDPPDGEMAAYLASLERLRHEGLATLFPAHGSPQGGALRRIEGLIRHRLDREAKVLAALAAPGATRGRSVAELVELAYADTPKELWPYAERSLLAHLVKLEAEGRARHRGERWSAAA